MNALLLMPVIIPLLTAIIALFAWRAPQVQRWFSLIGASALLTSSLVLLAHVWDGEIAVSYLGNWPAPFGIVFVADIFGAVMVVLNGLMGVAVAIYSLADIDKDREHFGYYPLLHVLLMGVSGAFLTGDIFNLYVWFEVMLMASFVLMALGGERAQLEGAIKYVTLNLISSVLFLSAVGILYGIGGTLNMADIARQFQMFEKAHLTSVVAVLFLVAFGIKAAVFPLFFWLPASYHTPPVAVSAIFAGLLTKVGVYAMIRVFSLIFVHDIAFTHTLILVIAGFTMVTGVLGATAQGEIRRILSFHIISQIGYMIMGLGLFTPLALAGSVFYLIHHIIVKTNLFLVSGVIKRLSGSFELKNIGGYYRSAPVLAMLFLIPAFSLAGIPPLSGFWAKFALVRAGLDIGEFTIVLVALVVSLLTVFSMTKIWGEAFWKPPPDGGSPKPLSSGERVGFYVPMILLAMLTVLIGLYSEPLFSLAQRSAEQLLNPELYISAVLRGRV
jgi:multicomponent Na+:H+ antiporter subunit D